MELLRKARSAFLRRRLLIFVAALPALVFATGMRGKLFFLGTTSGAARPGVRSTEAAPAARLIQLDAGTQLEGEGPPAGWTHLVLKSIPRLTSGDLDTVSENAHEIAQRIRPLIVADVKRSSDAGNASFHLDRVGVGLCAPAEDGGGDIVITGSSVQGTRGTWTTKQRLILSAIAYESSRARLAAATSTLALVRTPVTFLASGTHHKIDMCYAVLVDPENGNLQTFVWPDTFKIQAESASPAKARRLVNPVFDLPQDVYATRILGGLTVSWSFAISGLPDGPDEPLPRALDGLLRVSELDSARSVQFERELRLAVERAATEAPAAGL
jgi:hypothetical protein